jgi:K+-dependent Na+/Ca+ exchanger-like protein
MIDSGMIEMSEGMEESRRLVGAACKHYYFPGGGGVIIPILLILWIFSGLAIVCDEFFQPALEAISEALNLSPDVAGATFLAAGSSAPELFTSAADAFGDSSSIGMGTIVGSAMFNILVIVAGSAFVAGSMGMDLKIDYRPVTRDVCFYVLAILLLAVFFIDSEIMWWEALLMWLTYVGYIVFMVFNSQILAYLPEPHVYKISPVEGEDAVEGTMADKSDDAEAKKVAELELSGSQQQEPADNTEGTSPDDVEAGKAEKEGGEDAAKGKEGGEDAKDEEEEEEEGPFFERFFLPEKSFLQAPLDWVWYCTHIPFTCAFTFTIPDCEKKRFKEWYWCTFIMAILWIGLLCHYMVEFAVEVACRWSISPIVMGVLVLAVGTSIPDAIGSMLAARKGEADMAIANAIGSNVFDVLLGLGLPWFLVILIRNKPYEVCSSGITTAVIILFCTVVLFVCSLQLNKWRMNSYIGVMLLILYGLYVIWTIVSALVFEGGC